MSGFKVPERLAVLKFNDEPYVGLEVRARLDVSLATWGELGALISGNTDDVGDVVSAFERFAEEALESWNVQGRDGQPIPATGEGMKMIPPQMAAVIMREWQEAVANPPGPLSQPSENGVGAAASIPALESLGDFSRPNSSTDSPNDTDAPPPES